MSTMTTATSTASVRHFPPAVRLLPIFLAILTTVHGGKNLQTAYDQQQQFQRTRWPQQQWPTSASVTQNRHQFPYEKPGQNEVYDWYWDVQPFLGQNGAMSDHRPSTVTPTHSRHSASKNPPTSSSSSGPEDVMDEDSPSSAPANPTAPSDTNKSEAATEDGSNDLESLVNEYYYVGQKYETLKTPSQRWVQNYFKNVLPNVVQSVRARWLDVRKRAGLESVLALPVVGGVAMAVAGLAGLSMYAYRSRTVVVTAKKRRSLNEDDEGYSLGENVVKLMELAKEMYDGYDVRSVDCHRRLMCQLSKTEAYRQVGADKAFTLASFVGNWIDLPPPVRVMVDQLKYAVSFGKKDQENAEKRLRESRRLQQLQVPYYVNSDASVSSAARESHGQQSLDKELRDSCEAAFPDCDFSFEKFIVEHRRK